MPYRNTAQTITIFVFSWATNQPLTGAAAYLTIRGIGDGVEFTPAAPNVTEVDAANAKGSYNVHLAAEENNYSFVTITGSVDPAFNAYGVITPLLWSNESDANLAKILGTALTETTGYLAAAFKKFFNVGTPTGTVNSLPDAVAGATSGLALVGSVMGKSPATLASADVTGNLPAQVKGQDDIDFGDIQKASIKAEAEAALTTQGYNTDRASYLDEVAAANLPADVDGLTSALADFGHGLAALQEAVADLPAPPDISGLALEAGIEGHLAAALETYEAPTATNLTTALGNLLLALQGDGGPTLLALAAQGEEILDDTAALPGDPASQAALLAAIAALQGALLGLQLRLGPLQPLRVNLDGGRSGLTVKQGENLQVTAEILDAAGAAVDVSLATFFLGAKKKKTDATYIFSKDNAVFTTSQAALGIISFNLAAADTSQSPGPYLMELQVSWTGPPDVVQKSADIILNIERAVIPAA